MADKDIYDIIHEKYDKRWKRDELIVDAERFKTYDEVFDHQNLLNIYKLMRKGAIETLECPISTGKEANVYRAKTSSGDAAVKIFRTSTATFKAFLEYIDGDPRFKKIDRSRRGLIYTWSLKEHMNLKAMYKAGIRVPKPRAQFRNILVMDYISYEGSPAPQIRVIEAGEAEWRDIWEGILSMVRTMVEKCRLVHSDLSEYNVLYDGEPVIIDVGQTLNLHHPRAKELLERDLGVISSFFRKKGVSTASEEGRRLLEELLEGFPDD